MKIVILADFTSNSKETKLAKSVLGVVGPAMGITGVCSRGPSNGALEGVSTVIQFLPEKEFVHIPGVRNIGVADSCSVYSNIVDELWDDFPTFIPKSLREAKLEKLNIPHLDGEYVFYTINDNYDKSNTDLIIKAFTQEFDPAEPVNLVIKTNRVIDEEIKKIKESLGLYKDISSYKKQVVISSNFNDYQKMCLHATYDCYINSTNDDEEFMYCSFFEKPYITNNEHLRDSMRLIFKHAKTWEKYGGVYAMEQDIIDYFFRKLSNE